MNRNARGMLVWLILVSILVFASYQILRPQRTQIYDNLPFNEFHNLIEQGKVAKIYIGKEWIEGEFTEPQYLPVQGRGVIETRPFERFRIPRDPYSNYPLEEELLKYGVTFYIEPSSRFPQWLTMLLSGLLPVVLFIAVMIFISRQMQGAGNKALSFGRSRAKRFSESHPKKTFNDVAGCEEAKEELREVVDFLKDPKKYQRLGGRIPKGVLLVGPPGTGKTLLARAVAGEAGVPFFSISGSDFVEMFVGVGASRVRDLFETGRKNAPCLTGDAMITLSDGRKVTIQEMFERQMVGVKVPAMTDDFQVEEATVIGVTRRQAGDLYKITTIHSEIKATGNHLFPVLREGRLKWIRADELQVGDFIASPRRIKTGGMAKSVIGRGGFTDLPDEVPRPNNFEPHSEMQTLKTLCYGDILWAKVVGVKPLPDEDYVYDLVLDRLHNFVAEGMFVHNCIIFIDELDAVGRYRGAGIGGGHDEREQTLNQLLVEMSGFDSSEGVIVLAATNRPDILDPALLRPGRFDRQIVVDLPDVKGRAEIFKIHLKNVRTAPEVWDEIETLAKGTPYFSGADIENMVNEAALIAARRNKEFVDMECLEEAKDKVMMGPERRSMLISEREKRVIAYHEAGHALVSHLLPEGDPNYKCSIIPRGRALGVTQRMPLEERHNYGRRYLLAEITTRLAGRVAEELIFGDPTTGAKDDFERATELARSMVCEWGMSEKLGPVTFGKREEQIFLGKELARHKDYSEQTALEIDNEVKRIVNECYDRAKRIIQNNMDKLKRLAEALLEKEVLDAKEIEEVLGPRPSLEEAQPAKFNGPTEENDESKGSEA